MNITSGKIRKKQKVVIYGPEGIGKSTLAAQFPDPLFIDTEGSTDNLDVKRFDRPTSWAMLQSQITYVRDNPGICGTLIIDTMDWAERLCVEDVLATHQKKGIEEFGYGSGYVYLAEAIGRFLNLLGELIDRDICNVVLTCHAQVRKFEQPGEKGAFDRYELKLGKKTSSQTAPLVKEWADMVLFLNYEIFTVKANDNEKDKKYRAEGGRRVIYTEHHPCWDAKNRHGLPDKLDLNYESIRAAVEGSAPLQNSPAPAPVKVQPAPAPAPVQQPAPPPEFSEFTEVCPEPPEGLPQSLRDLMKINGVSEADIRFAVAQKGYFPEAMPVTNYPPDFINGVLIGAWDQVYAMIVKNKDLPFGL